MPNKSAIENMIREVNARVSGPRMKKVIGEGGAVVAMRGKQNAPTRYGYLKRSMGHAEKWYKGTKTAVSVAGPLTEAKFEHKDKPIWPAVYAHMVEGGTKPHSLERAVNMKMIRAHLTSTEDLVRLGRFDSRAEAVAWRNDRMRSRRIAERDFLLRQSLAAGERTHPGAKMNPFLGRAVEESISEVTSVVTAAAKKMIQTKA